MPMNIWKKYQTTSLVIKMSSGFLLGILVVLLFREQAELLNPLGTLLIRLLSLIALPVIFLTVVLTLGNMIIRQMETLGGKLIYYATPAIAVFIGVLLALFFSLGAGLTLPNIEVTKLDGPNVADIFIHIVPNNIFAAFAAADNNVDYFSRHYYRHGDLGDEVCR